MQIMDYYTENHRCCNTSPLKETQFPFRINPAQADKSAGTLSC
jgi:hypothetical protein